MLDLNLTFEQQRNRFERHHKEKFPAWVDYSRTESGYVNASVHSLFEGWLMAVQAQKVDEVTLYFGAPCGWKFEYLETGHNVRSPVFDNYVDQEKAIAWAKSQGFVIVGIED